MNYVIWYSVGSAAFLLVTMLSYFFHKRVPSPENRVYAAMLVLAFLSTVCDALAAGLEACAANVPIWLLYLLNGTFLISMPVIVWTCTPSNRPSSAVPETDRHPPFLQGRFIQISVPVPIDGF